MSNTTKTFLVNLNLGGNQLQNVALQPLATAPKDPTPGFIYFDETKKALGYYSGENWTYVGGKSDHGSIADITVTGDTISITYADGNVDTQQITYASAMGDEVVTSIKVGGINAGTKASALKGKTISQVIDDMLFAAVNPTITNPSASISFKSGFSSGGIYEVGATAPTVANFNTSFNQGSSTVIGQPTLNVAGPAGPNSRVYYGSTSSLASKIVLGSMSYKYHVETGEPGPQLVNSKGENYGTPVAAGTSYESSNVTIYGTYPYFANGVDGSVSGKESSLPTSFADTKLKLYKWTDTLIGVKFSGWTVSEQPTFYYPSTKKVTKVEWFNTAANAWEVCAASQYTTAVADDRTVQGNTVNYKKLTMTPEVGARQYRFTVSNA